MIDSFSKHQEQMIGGTKFSLGMYGPLPAPTRGELVPQELYRAERTGW